MEINQTFDAIPSGSRLSKGSKKLRRSESKKSEKAYQSLP
jgi:hypothetical protein